jgi:hypothetical protein
MFIGKKRETHECLGNRGFRKSFRSVLESLLHDAGGAVCAPAGQMSLAALGARDLNVRHQLHDGRRQEVGVAVKISCETWRSENGCRDRIRT